MLALVLGGYFTWVQLSAAGEKAAAAGSWIERPFRSRLFLQAGDTSTCCNALLPKHRAAGCARCGFSRRRTCLAHRWAQHAQPSPMASESKAEQQNATRLILPVYRKIHQPDRCRQRARQLSCSAGSQLVLSTDSTAHRLPQPADQFITSATW
jgi:hypothetical protein